MMMMMMTKVVVGAVRPSDVPVALHDPPKRSCLALLSWRLGTQT